MGRGPIRKVVKRRVHKHEVALGLWHTREVKRYFDVLECGHELRQRSGVKAPARRCHECFVSPNAHLEASRG